MKRIILLDRNIIQRKLLPPRDGPFTVVEKKNNGLLKIRKGATYQTVSIRRLNPYLTEVGEASAVTSYTATYFNNLI